MNIVKMIVTPQQAAKWLAEANTGNRQLRPSVVEKYAFDMLSSNWKLTHQGIAFYADGVLADGQHRLAAIVSANIPVEINVTFGLPRDAGFGIDQHSARRAEDVLRIAGEPEWLATLDAIAVARFITGKMGAKGSPLSPLGLSEFLKRNERYIRPILEMKLTRKKYLCNAGVFASYVCAHFGGETIESLQRFANVFASGEIAGPHENAAIRLREYLMRTPIAWVGAANKATTSKKTQRAIYLFCRGMPVTKLAQCDEYTYPSPT